MTENILKIPVVVKNGPIEINIYGETIKDLAIYKSDAHENGESAYQIFEGCSYEYKLPTEYALLQSDIVKQSKINKSTGYILPNIYVGTLQIDILDQHNIKVGDVKLEVQSKKAEYREEYRLMLEEIAEKSTDLILHYSSPVSQLFETNFESDSKVLYQRFAFINSILNSIEFTDSIHKIISSPVTIWKENEIVKDIRNIKRITNSGIRQLSSAKNRISINAEDPLYKYLKSIPSKIRLSNKEESVDSPENRFIKHVLNTFQTFFIDFRNKVKHNLRIQNEATIQIEKLEQFLSHSVFKSIATPNSLPLNSPILQKKEGYREILRIWFMFELASKLIWHGGDDVYSANKKDVAVLYEYWLFFKLLEIISSIFEIDAKSLSELIKVTSDGLGLQLQQGRHTAIKGVYNKEKRKLNIEFSYNRTFRGDNSYPNSGSWTRDMRPDYTLSIWPFGIQADEAERDELIVHIHFDAKYKVEDISGIFGTEEDFTNEKIDQRKGTYKRGDLLKMHSYKDAIRRTAGSYILYPGKDAPYKKAGFHEIIPGLGAFSFRPSKDNNGSVALVNFIQDVLKHFMNRTSQRERFSYKTYEVFKKKQTSDLFTTLPETIGRNRGLIPDETYVLIGYYKNLAHLDWIKTNHLYNTRTGDNKGSLHLGIGEISARYLLLYTGSEYKSSSLYKIESNGPRIFSKNELLALKYPDPKREFYLVYSISQNIEQEFYSLKWDISKINNLKLTEKGMPFCITLSDFMKIITLQ